MGYNYSSVARATELAEAVTGSATVLKVSSVAGLPTVPFTVVVDVANESEEIVTVTGVAGLNLTVTRGEDGTAAVPHQVGAVVRHMAVGRDFRQAQAHLDASSDVHGVGAGSSVVGTATTQTVTNKTISGDDNTFLAVPGGALNDGTVTTPKLGTGAVTTSKISDANVTTPKLADAGVTTVKIADANVTTGKLADAGVTTAKVADLNVTEGKLADGAVTTAKVGDAQVTRAKMAADVTAGLPRAVATGSVVLPGGVVAFGSTSVAVTFPVGRFSSSPVVVATANDERVAAAASGQTVGGCTIHGRNNTGADAPAVTVTWVAVLL